MNGCCRHLAYTSVTTASEGLASNYARLAGFGALPAEEGFSTSREMIRRALAIDPEFAPAHAALGWNAITYEHDLAAAARPYQRALELDPTDTRILRTAALLTSLGRLDQAITVQEFVVSRDPLGPAGYSNLGIAYLSAGRWDDSVAALQTALRLSPDYIGGN